ncbi:MAG TPA: pilus assembly protein PilP [Polyangiaceae bacterium]|jgi:type IV pilus assembly protein PilP
MRAAVLSLTASLLLVYACSDAPIVKKAPAPPASSSVEMAAAPSASTAPKIEVEENEFTESERSRDPFRSFASRFTDDTKAHVRSQREVVLSEYSIDELKLIGIVTRMEPAKAMLVDPAGKGFVIQRGQFVGRADVVQATGQSGATYEINWRVDRIREGDVVLVREDPSNPDVPSATRVIPLRPEGQGQTAETKN